MRALGRLLYLFPLLFTAGCVGAENSSNPLSATVAGPIPGIEISAPSLVTPASGAKVPVDQQPITLVIGNSATNGPRPLSYAFDVATDSGFASKVFSRDGIAPGSGQTALRLPDALQTGRTYYWRSRAEDGANTGPYSAPMSFNVFTPIIIDKPPLLSPNNNEKVTSLQPTFRFSNAPRSGPVGAIKYEILVTSNETFATLLFDWNVNEQSGQTSAQQPQPGTYGQYLFWKVRAYDPPSGTVGPWSDVRAFLMPDTPVSGGGGGGGGGPIGNWQACGSTPGLAIVQCVWNAVNPAHTPASVFEVTKRVVWLLRGSGSNGAGLLIKNGGENIVSWQGRSFAAARLVYPDGHLYKIETDVPNGPPAWSDEGVDPGLIPLRVNPIDPSLP